MRSVRFKNRDISMAGNLYLPNGFQETKKYPAIVCVHPGGGVKEQTIGVYAQRLAEAGSVTLAYDSSYQGESGGTPHFFDEPMNRVDALYSAIDYVTTLPYVDQRRIGVLGVCAGGGFAIKASSLDRRVKSVAVVSAVDVGAATRKGWEGKGSQVDFLAMLEAVAKVRTDDASSGHTTYAPYVPPVGDKTAPRDMQEAAEYYLTPRGQHPNAQNKMLINGTDAWAGFEAFDLVDTLLTQSVLVVAGSEAGSLWHSKEFFPHVASKNKELCILDGYTHVDLYDGEGQSLALRKLIPFYQANL